jgi:putative SOS response-associated peptidase YedK
VDESGVENDLKTFSIVTADAALSSREDIQSLHDRQPVFLCSSSAVDHWLQGNSGADTSTATLLDPSAAPLDLGKLNHHPLYLHYYVFFS